MSLGPSPCIGVCRLDADAKLCLGCGRRLDEIAAWTGLSDADRRAVMAELPGRLRGAASRPLDGAEPVS